MPWRPRLESASEARLSSVVSVSRHFGDVSQENWCPTAGCARPDFLLSLTSRGQPRTGDAGFSSRRLVMSHMPCGGACSRCSHDPWPASCHRAEHADSASGNVGRRLGIRTNILLGALEQRHYADQGRCSVLEDSCPSRKNDQEGKCAPRNISWPYFLHHYPSRKSHSTGTLGRDTHLFGIVE